MAQESWGCCHFVGDGAQGRALEGWRRCAAIAVARQVGLSYIQEPPALIPQTMALANDPDNQAILDRI